MLEIAIKYDHMMFIIRNPIESSEDIDKYRTVFKRLEYGVPLNARN